MSRNVDEVVTELLKWNRNGFAADIDAAREFHIALEQEENDRLRSWEHCYTEFSKSRARSPLSDEDKDCLALHLAFYLASWGMYRGSSFLLQRDYKVHVKAVETILKYDSLFDVQLSSMNSEQEGDFVKTLWELRGELKRYYAGIRKGVREQWGKNIKHESVTDTLITKILMGTLGCVPAYDRFVVSALGEYTFDGHKLTKRFTKKSIEGVIRLVRQNRCEFEDLWRNLRRPIKGRGSKKYPQMKLVDFVLWTKGFLDERQNGAKKKRPCVNA